MRIGFMGAGRIGGTLARQLAALGHDVAVSNSRGPETLAALVASIGERGQALTAADAARWGELLVVSVPFGRYRELPADGVAGKVVIDTNNYYPNRDGQYTEIDADHTTSSEMLAAYLSGARVVKAFNNINWEHLRDLARPAGAPGRIVSLIGGREQYITARLVPDSPPIPAGREVVIVRVTQGVAEVAPFDTLELPPGTSTE